MRWLAVLVLVGCAPGPEWPAEFPFQYKAGCFAVKSEIELDPSAVETNASLLGPILSPVMGDPCRYPATVHVLAVEWWNEHDGKGSFSHYDLFAGITVGRSMIGWAHELLHARDVSNLAIGTGWHEGWDKNGYQAAYERFAAETTDPSTQAKQTP